MTIRLNGATSGYTEIDAPAVAGSNTLVLPTGNGSAGNILGTDGSGNLSWVNGQMVLATSQATTSGTSKDFTGIPSWAKRITASFVGVSTNGSSIVQIQLGTSSGFVTSGYLGAATVSGVSTAYSSGILIQQIGSSAYTRHGSIVINNVTGNTWAAFGVIAISDQARTDFTAGSIALAATLTQLRITTVNGTDAFDAGTVNILYEG
jgi:hypothetical protein